MAILTKKFSEFLDAGNLGNDDVTVGLKSGSNARFNNPWTFLEPGPTGDRPPLSAAVIGRLRFNTMEQAYEYIDSDGNWIKIEDSNDLANLLARLAAHTAGDGASMIGLEDALGVTSKTVQDLAEAEIIVRKNNGTLTNAQFLDLLPNGFVSVATGTGVLSSRVLTGTANQINITHGNGGGTPVWSLSSSVNLPGTFNIQNTHAVNGIIDDNSMATASTTTLASSSSIKAYVDRVDLSTFLLMGG